MRDLILWLHEMFPDIRVSQYRMAAPEFFGWIELVVHGVKLEYFETTVAPTLARGVDNYEITWENGYQDRIVIRVRRRHGNGDWEKEAYRLIRLVEATLK